MKLTVSIVFATLIALFLCYSFSIYVQPSSIKSDSGLDKEKTASGRLVWQKYNCQSCHQLYGLGGFLGPDLTNIISNKDKGEPWVRAMLTLGVKQMPVFHLSDTETDQLISFLKATDASGVADPRSFITYPNGMIEHHEQK